MIYKPIWIKREANKNNTYPYECVEKFSVPITRLNKQLIFYESTSSCREGLSFIYPDFSSMKLLSREGVKVLDEETKAVLQRVI